VRLVHLFVTWRTCPDKCAVTFLVLPYSNRAMTHEYLAITWHMHVLDKCGLVQTEIKHPGAMPIDFFRDGYFRWSTVVFPTNTRQLAESQPTTIVQRLGTNYTRTWRANYVNRKWKWVRLSENTKRLLWISVLSRVFKVSRYVDSVLQIIMLFSIPVISMFNVEHNMLFWLLKSDYFCFD